MAQVTLTWHDREAQAALAGLPDVLEVSVLQQSLRTVAKFLLPKIAAATPVGQGTLERRRKHVSLIRFRGGRAGKPLRVQRVRFLHLRDSYVIRARKRRRKTVGVLIRAGTRERLGIPQARGYYPAHLEFGWTTARGHHHVRGRQYMKQPAHVNAAPALALLSQEIRTRIAQTIRP